MKYQLLILSSVFFIHTSQCLEHNRNDFDFFVYAQIWPVSGCVEWEERSQKNTCTIPNYTNWTVHGLWPTKNYTIGPLHCNHTPFNFTVIKPILDELKVHWTNVRANTPLDQFWGHEWTKHGTCAMQLPSLDNELKYFKKGLELNAKYPIGEYLVDAKILPGGKYTATDIIEAIKTKIGDFNPALECEKMEEFVRPVLTQISICLDKSFNIIGCDRAHGGIYGRCPRFDLLEYPKTEKMDQRGQSGTVWGIIIGSGITMILATYLYKTYCQQRRYQGYEEI